MGLDIYVGTLTRYYIGDWDSVVHPGSRGGGDEMMIVRIGDNGHESPDPVQVREDVLEWMRWMNEEVDVLEARLEWPEERDVPYFTDKPTWDAFGALQLWAAYDEHPALPRPARLPEDWPEDPAYAASQGDDFESRYPNLLFGTEFWLPVRVAEIFDAPEVYGEDTRFGSVPAFLEELEELNRRTWKASEEDLERWRADGLDEDGDLESLARFALAVFLPLVRHAAEFGLPLLLD